MKSIIIFVILVFMSCTKSMVDERSNQPSVIDDSMYSVITLDTTFLHASIFGNASEALNLTSKEVARLEPIIVNFLNQQEQELKDLTKYKRQYIPVKLADGRSIVTIIFFCYTHGINWKIKPVIVKDGGNCYFSLRVDLETNECFDFFVNGEA